MNTLLNSLNLKLLFHQATSWFLAVAGSVALILFITLISLRLVRFLTGRLHVFIKSHTAANPDPQEALEAEKRLQTLMGIVHSGLKVTIWVVASMMILRKVGIDIAPIIAGAGIVGLAVGFGAQELVRDFISGFFMLLENQVRSGDMAVVNGTGGVVERVGLRTIVLRDVSGVVHIFQNGKINTLANMTKEWSAVVFEISVSYKENTNTVSQIIEEVASQIQKQAPWDAWILQPIEVFGVESFGESSVVIKARIKTIPSRQHEVGREFRRCLKLAFEEKGIEIPYPHRTLVWGADQSATPKPPPNS